MGSPSLRNNKMREKEMRDNIFLHIGDNYNEQETLIENELVLPDEDLSPKFLGIFPSSSPTETPSESPSILLSDALALKMSQTGNTYFSVDDLSTSFGSYCPSLAFEKNRDSLSSHVTEIFNSKTMASLQGRASKSENKSLTLKFDWGGEKSTMYVVEGSLIWAAVSLGLGIWLFLLSAILKAATAKNKTSSKSISKRKVMTRHITTRLPPPSFQQDRDENEQVSGNEAVCIDESMNKQKQQDFVKVDGVEENQLFPSNIFERPPSDLLFNDKIHTNATTTNRENNGSEAITCVASNVGKNKPSTNKDKKASANIDGSRSDCSIVSTNTENTRRNKEHDVEEEQHFMPVLPIMSDISIPPGLSSSSSFSSEHGGDCTGVNDEASTEVFATNDIYTGSSCTRAEKEPQTVYYLAYCIEEQNMAENSVSQDGIQCDSSSYLLTNSSENVFPPSSLPSVVDESLKLPSLTSVRNKEMSGPVQSSKQKSITPSIASVERKEISNQAKNQNPYSKNMTTDGKIISKMCKDPTPDAGNVSAERNTAKWSLRAPFNHPSLGRSIEASKYLSMMPLSDDSTRTSTSTSTINLLLADSESSVISNERFDQYNTNFIQFSQTPSRIISFRKRAENYLEYPKQIKSSDAMIERRWEKEGIQQVTQGAGSSMEKKTSNLSLAKRNKNLGDSTLAYHGSGFEFAESVTKDLEALILESDERRRRCGYHRKSRGSCFLGNLLGQRITVGLACVLMIFSVVILVTIGVMELYKFQQAIDVQFDSLINTAMDFNINDLYVFLGELEARKQEIYFQLDGHCPDISSSLCDYSFESSSCNLDGVPLEKSWTEFLAASDKIPLNNPQDPLFNWLINSRDQSVNMFSVLRIIFTDEIGKWKMYLSIELVSVVGLFFLAVGVSVAVSSPIVEKYYTNYTKKKASYFEFGKEKYGSGELCPYSRFSFCSNKAFTLIFWFLFITSWILGMIFSTTMSAVTEVCNSDGPNGILTHVFENWDESIFSSDSDIIDLWTQQLHYCVDNSIQNESSIISPQALTDRIDLLSSLVGPIQSISVGIQQASTSGVYQAVCGRETDSVLRAIHGIESQICNEVTFMTNKYLELMSCENSSWLSTYHNMVRDSICSKGLNGLRSTVVLKVSILFFSITIWALRSAFLNSSVMNQVSQE